MIWYNTKHSLFLVETETNYTTVNMEHALQRKFTENVLKYYPQPLTNHIGYKSLSYVEDHHKIHRKLFGKNFRTYSSLKILIPKI